MCRTAGAPARGRVPADGDGGRRRGRPRRDHRRFRRALTIGLPTVWGATAITYKLACPLAQQNGLGARIVTCAVFFVVGTGLILHVRYTLLGELRQARRVAGAAQNVLLRPLPPRIDGLAVAAAQLSADRGATVGGDLYEAVATEHGVRVVMGDVRGHGLAALGTVAALLGSFREAAHDEPSLARVLRRLDRAMARHLRERARAEHPSCGAQFDLGEEAYGPVAEEFVTVLLLEIGRDGTVHALNCGHPWPFLIGGGRVERLATVEPLPPLGPFDLPADLTVTDCGRLLPGEALCLHTDGAEDARNARGRFFALREALEDAVRDRPTAVPQAVLGAVFTALLHHTGGDPTDDIALLVLRNDREPRLTSGARGTARQATTNPQPTNHL